MNCPCAWVLSAPLSTVLPDGGVKDVDDSAPHKDEEIAAAGHSFPAAYLYDPIHRNIHVYCG